MDGTAPACDAGGAITRSFVIRTLRIAPASIGANIDGLDNSSTPNSIAGCRRADGPLGIENQAWEFDLDTDGIPSSAAQSGITNGTIALTFAISQWNGTANDDCVDLSLTGIGLLGGLTVRTAIAAGEVDARLPADSGWDVTGAAEGLMLTLPVRGLYVHLELDQTLTELVVPASPSVSTASFLAGYVVYANENTSPPGDDFRPRLKTMINTISPSGSLWPSIDAIGKTSRDLHVIGGLRPCMMVGSNATVVDSDAISTALLLSTNPP
jgi:hypothetical protein